MRRLKKACRAGAAALAAQLEPGAVERGERAVHVVGERDDVVDRRRAPLGCAPWLGGRAGGGDEREPVRGARPPAPRSPSSSARRRARCATSPIGSPGAKPSARPGLRRSPGRAIVRGRRPSKMSVTAGASAIISGIETPAPASPRPAPPQAPEPASPHDPRAPARLARVVDRRRRVRSSRSRASSTGPTQQSAPRLPQDARRVARRRRRRAALRGSPRSCAASAGSGCSSTRAARRRAATPRSSTSSATWATTCCPRARATRSASC